MKTGSNFDMLGDLFKSPAPSKSLGIGHIVPAAVESSILESLQRCSIQHVDIFNFNSEEHLSQYNRLLNDPTVTIVKQDAQWVIEESKDSETYVKSTVYKMMVHYARIDLDQLAKEFVKLAKSTDTPPELILSASLTLHPTIMVTKKHTLLDKILTLKEEAEKKAKAKTKTKTNSKTGGK